MPELEFDLPVTGESLSDEPEWLARARAQQGAVFAAERRRKILAIEPYVADLTALLAELGIDPVPWPDGQIVRWVGVEPQILLLAGRPDEVGVLPQLVAFVDQDCVPGLRYGHTTRTFTCLADILAVMESDWFEPPAVRNDARSIRRRHVAAATEWLVRSPDGRVSSDAAAVVDAVDALTHAVLALAHSRAGLSGGETS